MLPPGGVPLVGKKGAGRSPRRNVRQTVEQVVSRLEPTTRVAKHVRHDPQTVALRLAIPAGLLVSGSPLESAAIAHGAIPRAAVK